MGEKFYFFVRRKLESKHYDYFVFGHRHLPMEIEVGKNSTYFNLGDWINFYTYGVFDGEKFELKEFTFISIQILYLQLKSGNAVIVKN